MRLVLPVLIAARPSGRAAQGSIAYSQSRLGGLRIEGVSGHACGPALFIALYGLAIWWSSK
ncbi:hypothetical protein [Streptomyces bobili]